MTQSKPWPHPDDSIPPERYPWLEEQRRKAEEQQARARELRRASRADGAGQSAW